MTQLERAVESTGALVLARIIAPAIMTIGLAFGGWVGNSVYEELRLLRAEATMIRIEQRGMLIQIQEHERRLNSRDNPRASPGSYTPGNPYGGGPK